MKVIVLGAGPAGTSCAIQLCKAQVDVTLLDIAKFPRHMPGESCHPGIEPLLSQLGIWEEIIGLGVRRNSHYIVNANGHRQAHYYNYGKTWEGLQLPRGIFDALLLKKACSLGAKFYPESKTYQFLHSDSKLESVLTSRGSWNFDYLVDATGRNSLTSRKLGIGSKYYSDKIISHYALVAGSEMISRNVVPYFEHSANYWGYIAPIDNHAYSVTFSSKDKGPSRIVDFISERLGRNFQPQIIKGYETSWKMSAKPRFKNLFLVGDAFLSFDPTSSKGILKGILSGMYVASMLSNIEKKKISYVEGQDIYQEWGRRFIESEISSLKELLPTPMTIN